MCSTQGYLERVADHILLLVRVGGEHGGSGGGSVVWDALGGRDVPLSSGAHVITARRGTNAQLVILLLCDLDDMST